MGYQCWESLWCGCVAARLAVPRSWEGHGLWEGRVDLTSSRRADLGLTACLPAPPLAEGTPSRWPVALCPVWRCPNTCQACTTVAHGQLPGLVLCTGMCLSGLWHVLAALGSKGRSAAPPEPSGHWGRGTILQWWFHTWFFSSLTATTFFHHVNLQYSTISEFCTGEACQTMAVCNTQYYWYDERGKKVKCTAPQYVDFVMSSVQKLVTDEDVFPTKYGREFPSSFESLVKKICKYLFHVLAHIYWSHFKETLALELHGHLNTLYVHFILFAREFNLLDPKETAVMDDLTEVLCSAGGRGGGGGDGASGGGTGAQNHVKER
uniref:MOB kinase activator 2 n=1 Tax=Canis lupus familiaris TaxID=9615 RepID=A0A8C0TSC6_CANLF